MSPRRTIRPKRALISIFMEVTFKCCLLGHSLSPCFSRSCLHVVVALAFGLPTLFSLNNLANSYQESSQVRWRACHVWFGFGTLSLGCSALSLCLLFSLLLFVAFFTRRTLSISARHNLIHLDGVFEPLRCFGGVPYGRQWSVCGLVVFVHPQCGLNPETLMALI